MQKVSLINFPCFKDPNGDLVVLESMTGVVPFSIARVFNVRAKIDSVRGHHAHKYCTQLLVCSNGALEVTCDDGCNKEKFILDDSSIGLLISPRVWAEQKYLQNDTVLTVLCDQAYDEGDYIRDYGEFMNCVNK